MDTTQLLFLAWLSQPALGHTFVHANRLLDLLADDGSDTVDDSPLLHLLSSELIEAQTSFRDVPEREFRITEKGRAHLRALRGVPLPIEVRQWVTPKVQS